MSIPTESLFLEMYYSNACWKYPKKLENLFSIHEMTAEYGFRIKWNPVQKQFTVSNRIWIADLENSFGHVFWEVKTNKPSFLVGLVPPDILARDPELSKEIARLMALKLRADEFLYIRVKKTMKKWEFDWRYEIKKIEH